jgi:outer membrane protein assembly factor BamD (BamD/ComL family)
LKNHSEVFDYARKVLDSKGVKDEDRAEAYYYRAKTAYEQGNLTDADADFKQVEKLTTKEWKAEATYTRIFIKYKNAEYKQVEKDLFDFFKQKPTYNYWLAKGFILLGDNYAQLGDTAQAKATLKSIIDKYTKTDDDILSTANAELDKLVQAENNLNEQKKMEIERKEEQPQNNNEPGKE